MGSLDGKVAFITGAGRGQGRSHAVRLAQGGADIIALDICDDAVDNVGYGTVNTPPVINDVTFELVATNVESPGPDDAREAVAALNILPDVPLNRAFRRLGRRGLAVLGRGPLHHRRRAADRRGQHGQEGLDG